MFKRYLLLSLILVVLVNVTVPLYRAFPSISLEKASLSLPFGDKMLICTINGFEWVSTKDVGKRKQDGSRHYKCPLCIINAYHGDDGLLFAEDSEDMVYEREFKRYISYVRDSISYIREFISRPNPPRGPPTFSF